MADTHRFARHSGGDELWNVTLLPLPAQPRARPEAKSLENLDQGRSRIREAQIVTLPTSFESQLKAAGW